MKVKEIGKKALYQAMKIAYVVAWSGRVASRASRELAGKADDIMVLALKVEDWLDDGKKVRDEQLREELRKARITIDDWRLKYVRMEEAKENWRKQVLLTSEDRDRLWHEANELRERLEKLTSEEPAEPEETEYDSGEWEIEEEETEPKIEVGVDEGSDGCSGCSRCVCSCCDASPSGITIEQMKALWEFQE